MWPSPASRHPCGSWKTNLALRFSHAEAAAYLSALISGKEVVIRFRKIDRYGRIIATVYHGGRDVNLLMVRAGLAWHYAYFDDTPAYREAEKQARAARRGLWRQDNPVNPYEFRRQRKLNAK